MNPRLMIENLTNEIINYFHLPKNLCFLFIKKRLLWIYVAGWENGKNQRGLTTPIIQMNEYGNTIETHIGVRIAARKTKTSRSSISNVLSGKQHTAGGFLWKVVDNPVEKDKILNKWQKELT